MKNFHTSLETSKKLKEWGCDLESENYIEGCGDNHCHQGHYPYPSGEDGTDVDWGPCNCDYSNHFLTCEIFI